MFLRVVAGTFILCLKVNRIVILIHGNYDELSTKITILQLDSSQLHPQPTIISQRLLFMNQCSTINYIAIHINRMIRQLSKISSASKLEQPQSILPVSPSNKFKRTNKKLSIEETNATSEKTQSMLSQDTQGEKVQVLTRTNRLQKRQDSRNSSKIEDPFAVEKTNNSKIRTEHTESTQKPNFTKKPQLNLATQPALSSENEIKSLKPSLSPKVNISKPSIITPQAEIEAINKQEKAKVMLKRVPAFIFLLKRLLREKIAASLKCLWDNKRIVKNRLQKQANVLACSAAQLVSRVQGRLKGEAIQRCKMMTIKRSKQNYSIQQEIAKVNQQKIRQDLVNYLHLLSRSKLRSTFAILNSNRKRKQALSRCYPALFDFYEKRKVRQAFNVFKRSAVLSHARKDVLMNELCTAYKFCSRLIQAQSFKNILLAASSKRNEAQATMITNSEAQSVALARQAQSQAKKQKIRIELERIERQSRGLQQKVTQKRRDTDNQSKKFNKTIQTLQQKHAQAQKQAKQKTALNQSLKKKSEASQEIVQADPETQNGEKVLPLLQQLYCQVSKMNELQVSRSIPRLIKDYKLTENAASTIVQQWLMIGQKQALQGEIDKYENQILGHRRGSQSTLGKMMRQQSLMVAQMIKNYVKQRYLWGEVQKFVSTVL